ncbi:MAG: rhomboid family intramembrane serine protease [Candidatus Micrarchaeia archaeon]
MGNLTNLLLLAIGAAFVMQLISPEFENLLIFDPAVALSQPWRFVSSIFLHGGVTHIFFNSYALFMFGSLLERRVSWKDYLIIFFGAGILGSFSYYSTYLLGIIPPIPALGASGAIYGILGAVAMILPDLQIFVFFFPMKMRYAVIFWLALTFLGAFDVSSGVADAAHLGGLVFGIICGWLLSRKPPEFYQPAWEHDRGPPVYA